MCRVFDYDKMIPLVISQQNIFVIQTYFSLLHLVFGLTLKHVMCNRQVSHLLPCLQFKIIFLLQVGCQFFKLWRQIGSRTLSARGASHMSSLHGPLTDLISSPSSAVKHQASMSVWPPSCHALLLFVRLNGQVVLASPAAAPAGLAQAPFVPCEAGVQQR